MKIEQNREYAQLNSPFKLPYLTVTSRKKKVDNIHKYVIFGSPTFQACKFCQLFFSWRHFVLFVLFLSAKEGRSPKISISWCYGLYFSLLTFLFLECLQPFASLTLSPPAVKTQRVSQCQAFKSLVRSSHTLVNWTFDILNRFSISYLACFWKHWMLFASVCSSFFGRTNATSALSLWVA
jgi:hypothetical protein